MSAPRKPRDPRNGLRTSATLATIFTILGHTVFGFEQPWADVLVALVTGYSCALFFEWIDARAHGRTPGYAGGGWLKVVDFLLSAHMTSITLSFLLYVNDRLWIMALTVALAIGSKYVFRVRQNGRLQHFFNPSNFAIVVVLIAFPYTGILPWAFTTSLQGASDWIVPLVIVGLGFRLNLLFTGRLPTIGAWLSTFCVLGVARALAEGAPIVSQLVPLTGVAFVLFTFYMITDPQTSPSGTWSQILFGSGIAVAYSALLLLHVQYTMFYSVTIVAATRGVWLYLLSRRAVAARAEPVPARVPGQAPWPTGADLLPGP